MSDYKMTDPALIKDFLYAGRAIFTIRSETSGEHWTYKVTCKKEGEPYFVSLLCDGDTYLYLGFMRDAGRYQTSSKACRPRSHVAHRVVEFLLKELQRNALHSKLSFFHEGKCAKCGKPLTNPESIERGFGPGCWAKR